MVTMEHDTPSHDYTPTYQISLIYRKRQKHYDSDTITLQKYQTKKGVNSLFNLNGFTNLLSVRP
jgi:hypothetical protein